MKNPAIDNSAYNEVIDWSYNSKSSKFVDREDENAEDGQLRHDSRPSRGQDALAKHDKGEQHYIHDKMFHVEIISSQQQNMAAAAEEYKLTGDQSHASGAAVDERENEEEEEKQLELDMIDEQERSGLMARIQHQNRLKDENEAALQQAD